MAAHAGGGSATHPLLLVPLSRKWTTVPIAECDRGSLGPNCAQRAGTTAERLAFRNGLPIPCAWTASRARQAVGARTGPTWTVDVSVVLAVTQLHSRDRGDGAGNPWGVSGSSGVSEDTETNEPNDHTEAIAGSERELNLPRIGRSRRL